MIEYAFSTDTVYSASYNVRVTDSYPSISYGKKQFTQTAIPGKRGTLTESDGTYSDTVVTISCDITDIECVDIKYTEFVSELQKSSKLVLGDLEAWHFKVKRIEVSDFDKYSDMSIAFTISFTCDPGLYLSSGDCFSKVIENSIGNPLSLAEPVYKLVGEGYCDFKVNGHTIIANVSGALYIDTERMISYREDGSIVNTSINGNYDDMYLNPGVNTFIVPNNFELYVKPNWRRLL